MNAESSLPNTPDFGNAIRNSWKACLGLLGMVLLFLPFFLWYGISLYGNMGALAACVAAAVCLLGAESALFLAGLFQRTNHAVSATLAGTFLRTGIPLFAGLYAQKAGGPLAEAGLFGMILVYYLITLLAETVLATLMIGPNAPPSNKNTVEKPS